MTRPNGPTAQQGGWPQQGQYPELDPAAAAQAQAAAYQNRRPAQQAFQPAPQGAADPAFHANTQGYGYPPAGASYAPQFDTYTPPTQPTQPTRPPQATYAEPAAPQPPSASSYGVAGYDPHSVAQPAYAPQNPAYTPPAYTPPAYAQQPQQPAYAPAAPAQAPSHAQAPAPAAEYGHYGHGYDPRADLRGATYDQWPAPAASPNAAAVHPAYEPAPAYAQPASYGASPQSFGDAYAPQPAAMDLNSYGLHVPQEHAELDHAQHGTALEAADQHDDYIEYEDEPPARSRKMLVVGALVGAIAVGGSLAYGYKQFFPGKTSAATPIVKSDGQPSRAKPTDPGGKQFAHPDSKIMGKLGDGAATATAGAATTTAASADDPNGTRKVQTLVVRPDGTIAPPPAPVEPPAAAPAAGQPVTVPGMTIVDGLGANRAPPPVVAPAAAPPPAPAAKVAAVAPPPAPAPPPVTPVAKKAAAPVAADPPPAPVAKSPVPKVAAAVAAPKPTGAGYMAVLASVPASTKSRMDALKQFADMQQKYGTVLANKTPDVQEANLGDKGTYHRLLVGPPGSREQASAVCNDLKAAGYNGCWVMAY